MVSMLRILAVVSCVGLWACTNESPADSPRQAGGSEAAADKASTDGQVESETGTAAAAAAEEPQDEPSGETEETKSTEDAKESPVTDASSPDKPHPALLDPSLAKEKAPDTYKVRMKTTKGDFVIEVHRDWAPNGADRFYNLVKIGYFKDIAFFRVLQTPRPFMAQFGIHGDPKVNAKWRNANIKDDPVVKSNQKGYVTFAQTMAPNSRSVQFFINYGDNSFLDSQRFAPFGEVVEGMSVVESLNGEYGEGQPRGRGPDQARVQEEGNAYLQSEYPNLDYLQSATLITE